jgi:hypothetical protein
MAQLGERLKEACSAYVASLDGNAIKCSEDCTKLIEDKQTTEQLASDDVQLCVNYWGVSKRSAGTKGSQSVMVALLTQSSRAQACRGVG